MKERAIDLNGERQAAARIQRMTLLRLWGVVLVSVAVVALCFCATGCGAAEHHDETLALQAEWEAYKEAQAAERDRWREYLAYIGAQITAIREEREQVDEILRALLEEMGE